MYPSDYTIDQIIADLRKLKKDICMYWASSNKALESDHHYSSKNNINMMWKKMEVENQLRQTTHKIKNSRILVSLEPENFYVDNMHTYKLWTPPTN